MLSTDRASCPTSSVRSEGKGWSQRPRAMAITARFRLRMGAVIRRVETMPTPRAIANATAQRAMVMRVLVWICPMMSASGTTTTINQSNPKPSLKGTTSRYCRWP